MVKADSYIVPNPDEQRNIRTGPNPDNKSRYPAPKKRNSKIIRDIITIRKADYS